MSGRTGVGVGTGARTGGTSGRVGVGTGTGSRARIGTEARCGIGIRVSAGLGNRPRTGAGLALVPLADALTDAPADALVVVRIHPAPIPVDPGQLSTGLTPYGPQTHH